MRIAGPTPRWLTRMLGDLSSEVEKTTGLETKWEKRKLAIQGAPASPRQQVDPVLQARDLSSFVRTGDRMLDTSWRAHAGQGLQHHRGGHRQQTGAAVAALSATASARGKCTKIASLRA